MFIVKYYSICLYVLWAAAVISIVGSIQYPSISLRLIRGKDINKTKHILKCLMCDKKKEKEKKRQKERKKKEWKNRFHPMGIFLQFFLTLF